jgi:hypothetical protein
MLPFDGCFVIFESEIVEKTKCVISGFSSMQFLFEFFLNIPGMTCEFCFKLFSYKGNSRIVTA